MEQLVKLLIFHNLIYSKKDIKSSQVNNNLLIHEIKLINNQLIYIFSNKTFSYFIQKTKTKEYFHKEPLDEEILKKIYHVRNHPFNSRRGYIFQYYSITNIFGHPNLNSGMIKDIKKIQQEIYTDSVLTIKLSNTNLLKIEEWVKKYTHKFLANNYWRYKLDENINSISYSFYLKKEKIPIIITFDNNYQYHLKYENINFIGNFLNDDFDNSFNSFIYENFQINDPLNSKLNSYQNIEESIFHKKIYLILDRIKKIDINKIIDTDDFYEYSKKVESYKKEILSLKQEIEALNYNINNSQTNNTFNDLIKENFTNLNQIYNNFKKDYIILQNNFINRSEKFT